MTPWPPPGIKWYYSDPACCIAHGDCREILPLLPKVDLVLTDPPYGINVGANQSSKESRSGLLVKGAYVSYQDTPENYKATVVPAVSSALSKAKRGAVFGFAPNIFLLPPPDVVGGVFVPAGCGRNRWGWTSFMPVLFYGHAPGLQNGAKPTAVESTDVAEKNGHPTPKPIKWFTWLVLLASLEGDTILDPFMGSGTTLRAAKDLGRRAIGIEIEERYCEIAASRLAQEVLPLDNLPAKADTQPVLVGSSLLT